MHKKATLLKRIKGNKYDFRRECLLINPDGSTVGYDYDPAGNRLSMTRTAGNTTSTTKYYYNEVNELTKFNVDDGPLTEFRYDNNGNRTTKIEPDNRITSYQYDYENRLTETRFHQGKWAGFEYEGDGNRITKLSAMTQPTYGNGNKTPHDDGIGNDPGYVPPGQEKATKQQADLQYMLLSNGNGGGEGGGNGGGNDGGNSGGNGGGNDGNNGGGNDGGNGGGNDGGNGGGNDGEKGGGNSGSHENKGNGNGNGNGVGNSKDKSSNGKSGDKVQNKDLKKEDREAKKEKAKEKNGYRQKGKYNNKGKHKGWYKNGKLPTEKVEVTYYLNDVSDQLTQVLMTYGEDGKYDAAYTYGLERIEVEDIDETRPESQDPLYYLYDGLGSVTYMVKPDGNTRDHYRYDEYGKPAPGNTKLSEDGRINLNNTFGYTGEQWDEETNLLYLRARYYEPETGRFLSRDTYEGELANPLSRHLFAYVGNNPVNRTDPSGKIWVGTTWVPSWENPKNGKLMVDAKRFAWALHLGVQNLNNGNYVVWTPAGKRYEYTAQYHGFADLFLQWNISTWHYWKIIAGDVYDGVYYGVGEMYLVGLSTGGFNHFASKGTAIEGTVNSIGKLTGSLDGLTAAERTVVNDLLSSGKNVQMIPKTTASKTPDFLVNGVKTELKSLENPNINTGITRIQNGFKQGAETVIIDGRQAGLTTEQANEILNRATGTYQNKTLPGQVEIWTNDGVIRR